MQASYVVYGKKKEEFGDFYVLQDSVNVSKNGNITTEYINTLVLANKVLDKYKENGYVGEVRLYNNIYLTSTAIDKLILNT